MLKNIAYSKEQIAYIMQVLAKNQGTIEALTMVPSKFRPELLPGLTQEVSNEISTCIRILETEYSHVSGV